MNQPLLSILIPSIPERITQAMELFKRIEKVMTGYDVEILMLTDNLKSSIGQKREKLKNAASGKYFAFVDDDDEISFNYFMIADVIKKTEADVIVFDQMVNINGESGFIRFSIENENIQFKPGTVTDRKPCHVCAWKTNLVRDIPFNDSSYGEDYDWAARALERVKTEHKIDAILHYYHFDSKVSRAEN